MLVSTLLSQAKDFGFEIFKSMSKMETNTFVFPELDNESDDYAEESLFDGDNYEFWSEDYVEESEPTYTVTGSVKDRFVEHNGLAEDDIIPVLKEMVADELDYQQRMTGLAVYLELEKIPKDKRNLPLYEYDGECGDQFAITGLDSDGFKVATKMGYNTAAFDENKLLTIDNTLSILAKLPSEVLNNPIKAIDLETNQADTISSVSLYDDDAEISENNQLAINVNM